MIHTGFASVCITPPSGKEIPGLLQRRVALGVKDDLFARAVVIDDGTRCAALVQTDAIVVPDEVVAAARKQAQALCGIRGKNCLIAATHTHSGGPVFDALASKADSDYVRFLAEQIATAVSEAHRLRRPALVGRSTGLAEGVAFNRRFVMRDGSQRTHPGKMNQDVIEAAGPQDPTVTVLAFRAPGSREPFGCVVHFACHATHMNGLYYSADYPKWVVETLRGVYGPDFGVVFLNGACGDVTQVANTIERPEEVGLYWCRRTGQAVGGAAINALAVADYYAGASVDTATKNIQVPIRPPTGRPKRTARELLGGNAFTPSDETRLLARESRAVAAMRRENASRKLEIMAMRVGDAVFWGVPGELFQEFAAAVSSTSPLPHTCCVELANGYAGYICGQAAFEGGGYEVCTTRSSYLSEDAGERVVQAASSLVAALHKRAAKEIATLGDTVDWIVEEGSDAFI